MPELPEVEIVKQSLEKTIKTKRIIETIINNRNLRYKIEKDFEEKIKNKKIIKVKRRAKYLILEIENKNYILIHLGMSGTLHLIKKDRGYNTNLSFYRSSKLPDSHNHICFSFKGFKIIYNDPRRFGFVKFFDNKKKIHNYLNKNGPEPLSSKFSYKYLNLNLVNKDKKIKNIMLDQKIVAGIGNIYASEILFYSRINPKIKGKNLNEKEIKKIIKFTKFVLKKAIKNGGSTIRNFKNALGNSGGYQDKFKVYSKENKRCPNQGCRFKIKKIKISNRSTFYCKKCQKNR